MSEGRTKEAEEDSASILCVGVCSKVDLLVPELVQQLLQAKPVRVNRLP